MSKHRHPYRPILVLAAILLLAGCTLPAIDLPDLPTFAPPTLIPPTPRPTRVPFGGKIYLPMGFFNIPKYEIMLGAGDITTCKESDGASETAELLGKFEGTIFTLGDTSNIYGAKFEYSDCFESTWGAYFERIRPTLGNHDYYSGNGEGYFDYFGEQAGEAGKGYYSYDVGAWHIVALNSNCEKVGGCEAGSPQEVWLRQDLEAHPNLCTLAYWHYPRFTSGQGGNHIEMSAFWDALYQAGAEMVLNGHDHNYERLAPQDPYGNLDLNAGIREFVVGTGGAFLLPLGYPAANSRITITDQYGILVLALGDLDYYWQFLSAPGGTVLDTGYGRCH